VAFLCGVCLGLRAGDFGGIGIGVQVNVVLKDYSLLKFFSLNAVDLLIHFKFFFINEINRFS